MYECLALKLSELNLANDPLGLFGSVSVAVLCSYLAIKVIWNPLKLYLLPRFFWRVRIQKLGRWAVITGATDGIGKGYAQALASRGLDIVLISRSTEKLERVKEEIINDYGRDVRTIKADFAETDIYEHISRELDGLDIAILVNNVGTTQDFGPFLDIPDALDSSLKTLMVNCYPMTSMCSIVLPKLIEKRKGVIVNMSSCLAHLGSTNSSTYAATKSYNLTLSRSLQRTYSNTGVIIQTLTPGMVQTNLLKSLTYKRETWTKTIAVGLLSVPVESFVESAINTIGWSDYCHGHYIYYYQDIMLPLLPESLVDRLMNE